MILTAKRISLLIPIFICLIISLIDETKIVLIHSIVLSYATIVCCFYPLRDFRIALLFFTILYSFFTGLTFYFLNSLDHEAFDNRYFELISLETVKSAISYNMWWISGILMHILLIRNFLQKQIENQYNNKINKNYILKKPQPDFILIIFFSCWILSMSGLDWSRILTEYTLEGVGTTFAINFILFTLIGNRFLEFRRLQLLDYIVLSSLFLGFSIFGARQPLFWGMIFLLLTISFLYLPNNFSLFSLARKKFAFKLFSLLILIGIIFTFIVWYRSNRNFELTIYLLDDFNIKLFFDLFLRLLFAETVYTFYNLFAIIENDLAGIISFTDLIYDFMIQFIPAMVFPEKYNAMIIYDLAREYNLAPFGTNYIVGFFALITSSTVGVFFFAFGYCHIIILVIRILFCFCKKKQEAIIIYCLFYTFASAYVVRGSVLGGFKLAVSISIVYLICNFIYTMFRNNKIVFLK